MKRCKSSSRRISIAFIATGLIAVSGSVLAQSVDQVLQAEDRRLNLAQQPLAFAGNQTVKAFLERSGQAALPLILVDGEVALAGRYPGRAELARWAGITEADTAESQGGCCSGSRCC